MRLLQHFLKDIEGKLRWTPAQPEKRNLMSANWLTDDCLHRVAGRDALGLVDFDINCKYEFLQIQAADAMDSLVVPHRWRLNTKEDTTPIQAGLPHQTGNYWLVTSAQVYDVRKSSLFHTLQRSDLGQTLALGQPSEICSRSRRIHRRSHLPIVPKVRLPTTLGHGVPSKASPNDKKIIHTFSNRQHKENNGRQASENSRLDGDSTGHSSHTHSGRWCMDGNVDIYAQATTEATIQK